MRAVIEEAFNERHLGRGASTITMQLVKNVFLSHERAIERKAQELFLSYWVTRLVPKPRILEIYLNMIEWGPGINGVAEAAHHYFDKEPSELSLVESVWTSSISPAPLRRAHERETGLPAWHREQINDLLHGMGGRGYLRPEEVALGLRQRLTFSSGKGQIGGSEPDEGSGEIQILDPTALAAEPGETEGAGADPTLIAAMEADDPAAARQRAFLALPVAERLRNWIGGARKPRGAGALPSR